MHRLLTTHPPTQPTPPPFPRSGSDDESLLAYQIAFDLVDAELSAFMLKVRTLMVCAHDSLCAGHSLPVAAALSSSWLLACGLAGSAWLWICMALWHPPACAEYSTLASR